MSIQVSNLGGPGALALFDATKPGSGGKVTVYEQGDIGAVDLNPDAASAQATGATAYTRGSVVEINKPSMAGSNGVVESFNSLNQVAGSVSATATDSYIGIVTDEGTHASGDEVSVTVEGLVFARVAVTGATAAAGLDYGAPVYVVEAEDVLTTDTDVVAIGRKVGTLAQSITAAAGSAAEVRLAKIIFNGLPI